MGGMGRRGGMSRAFARLFCWVDWWILWGFGGVCVRCDVGG